MTHGPPERKAKWVPFSGPRQGMPQSKHATRNGVSARGFLGEGRVKTHVRVGALERTADKQTGTGQRQGRREAREARGEKELAVPGGHF